MSWEFVEKNPPHDQVKWVKFVADIRENSTKITRQYATDGIWDEKHKRPSTFIWEEGNFACDCNRHLFFMRSIGIEPDESNDRCGDDRFSVNLINPTTGEIFYREFSD